MMEMKEQTESRKKYLAPVVVLMLCLVALTGAAYAYTSSVAVTNNTIAGEEFVLQVYDNEDSELVAPIQNVKGIDLTHVTTIGGTESVVVSANSITTYSYVGRLTIKDTDQISKTNLAMTIVADATEDNGTLTYTEVNTRASVDTATAGEITYTVNVALYKEEACTNAYDNKINTDSNGIGELWYKVTITAAGSITFGNYHMTSTAIANVQTGLAGEHFSLSFVATAPGTA